MLRLGQVDYINTLPLFSALSCGEIDAPFEIVHGHPSELNEKLRTGEIDAGFISSYEFIKNRELYELVEPFCLAAYHKLDSVTLHVRGNIDELEHQRVALTSASASSSALVRLLFRHYWQIEPHFEPLESIDEATSYRAFLLIGNAAMTHPHFHGYHAIDLAATWYQWTQTPMVFAVVAHRKETPKSLIDLLRRRLDQSLSWGERHLDELAGGLHHDYFQQMGYRMGERERAGLEHFAALVN